MRRLALSLLVLTACAGRQDPENAGLVEPGDEPTAEDVAPRPRASRSDQGPVRVPGAKFDVVIEADDLALSEQQLRDWIERSGRTVAAYYGKFPVPGLKITITGTGRWGIGFGQHWDGRFIKVRVGSGADQDTLDRDWVMVHEMLHAGFPDLERKHKWMQEGLSTYLQRIVEAQAGRMSDERVWGRFTEAMEYGRPKRGDRGLDITRTWGRLYWGGALFWMVADIRIREATDNRKSLEDALKGIVAVGGNGRQDWTTARVVEVGDEATGTTVLRDLYDEMALAPGDIDLDALWRRMGIEVVGKRKVVFHDDAELAEIRKSMTRG